MSRGKREGSAETGSSQIIREIPLIQRYARHNEAEDLRFRQFLKMRVNMSTEALDGIVRETTDAVWSQTDCTACAHCCRTLQVEVDRTDVARLSARLAMTPREFARRYVADGEYGTRHLAVSPCAFLGADNRCTVYEDRPKACRDFPYLHENHFTSRSLMMITNNAVCPIVFNVWQALKDRLGFRARRGR